jgi:uncharacterized protein (DUF2336 family)
MNNSRAIFGVILAAAALACVAALHHVLWSRPPSSPHPIEAPQAAASLAQQESMAQEFADLPRSVHTVPIVRQPAPAAPAPEQSTQTPSARVASQQQAIPTTLPSHAQPVDVCGRYGGRRIDFMRDHHAVWRCVYPRHR